MSVLTGSLSRAHNLTGVIDNKFAIYIGEDPYQGEYVVDPDFAGTTLATSGKTMLDDVTVNAIRVDKVSNPANGKTVYIGGIFNA